MLDAVPRIAGEGVLAVERGAGRSVRAAAASVDEHHRGLRALLVEIPALLGDDPFARTW